MLRDVHHWALFFPSTIMHCFTSVVWLSLRSVHTLKADFVVCARRELTLWELSRSHVTDEETNGDIETWQGLFPDHSCITVSHAKRFMLLYLPSVFDLWGRGNTLEVPKLKQLCLSYWLTYKQLSWTSPPLTWLVISIISEKATNCLLPYL